MNTRLQNFRGQDEIDPFERTRLPMPAMGQPTAPVQRDYVLYLRQRCPASQKAYEWAHALTGIIDIQNTDEMRARGEAFPPFLKGVPTLLDIRRREAFGGKACVAKLHELDQQINGAQRQEFRAQFVAESATVTGSPFVEAQGNNGDPSGVDAGGVDQYAPCEYQPSTQREYKNGKLKTEQTQAMIEEITGQSSHMPSREPTAAQISAIMDSIQEKTDDD